MERASCISERRIAEKGLGYTIKKNIHQEMRAITKGVSLSPSQN